MAIQEGNIKLLASQVMDDVDEGGGRSTGTAIQDGVSNAIFPDISELDRAYGRVNLRKTFVAVDTPTVDGYYGANVILADTPDDPKVSCTLFATNDGFDRRTDARNRLESYVVAGPLSNMKVYGNQLIGQQALVVYQREEQPLPEVGDVYCLSAESGVPAQQFFRVQKVESVVQTFTDTIGDFIRRVITITMSDRLRQTFIGKEPVRNSSDDSTAAKVRRTTVADASKYYGTRPLEDPASMGALTVKADTIYVPLVPSSEQETPIVLGDIQGATRVVPAGAERTLNNTIWGGSARKIVLPGQVTPRSLKLDIGATSSYWPKGDDGAGNVTLPNGTAVGTIDYTTGELVPDTVGFAAAWGSVSTVTYTPGGNISQVAFTHSTPITIGTRGTVYVQTVQPLPEPGTMYLDYMAMGKWYRLRDKGDGTIAGDESALGAGTINYVTGSIVVTLGALPDVGTALMWAWGSKVDTRIRTSSASSAKVRVTLGKSVVHTGAPGNVTVKFTKGGVLKTLTDDGAGNLSGSAETGTINYATGEVVINGMTDTGLEFTTEYGSGNTITEDFAGPIRNGDATVTVDLVGAPLRPRTVRLSWNVVVPIPYAIVQGSPVSTVTAYDDGAGSIKRANGATIGTIDYNTGALTFNPDTKVKIPQAHRSFGNGGAAASPVNFYNGTVLLDADAVAAMDFPLSVTYRNSDASTAEIETHQPGLHFEVAAFAGERIVANSLTITLGGSLYVDRSGTLYRDPSYLTGAGTAAGTVDYTAGTIIIDNWPNGVAANIAVLSCLTEIRGRTDIDVNFRTAGAPIRPASFYVQASALDGTLLTATADQSGNIAGAKVRGTVNNTTGVVKIEFGQMVAAAGNENESWYHPDLVVGGQIWKPMDVQPATIKYNSVVVSRLPLDANLIGLDPVRLPADGRVPVLRSGDIAVIHHTATTVPAAASNGQTVNCGRTRLSRVRVLGNDNAVITTGYNADLDAGTVTFADVTGYSQPVRVEHRIEDMALVSDAQINGQIAITRQLTHDFPDGSFISSALIIGDMRARVPILFDQATWNSVFSDVVSGGEAIGTFNDVLAPIAVTNSGAITERWALRFTNTTTFDIIGEHVGVIGSGNTGSPCAPVNPASGAPYFSIPAVGWGAGWAAGNVLRFNTIGALYPVWIARTIQQGQPTAQDDSFTVLIRGDIDRP